MPLALLHGPRAVWVARCEEAVTTASGQLTTLPPGQRQAFGSVLVGESTGPTMANLLHVVVVAPHCNIFIKFWTGCKSQNEISPLSHTNHLNMEMLNGSFQPPSPPSMIFWLVR